MAAFEFGAPQIAIAHVTCDDDPIVELVAARPQRREVILRNLTNGADCYIGTSVVATTTGMLLAQGETVTLATTAAVYGVTAAGTATIHVLELFQ